MTFQYIRTEWEDADPDDFGNFTKCSIRKFNHFMNSDSNSTTILFDSRYSQIGLKSMVTTAFNLINNWCKVTDIKFKNAKHTRALEGVRDAMLRIL